MQQPIGTGFTAATTADEVVTGIDLTGKTILITGGHAGLGLECSRSLAAAGATVIVGARDVAKARLAVHGIPRIEVSQLDLLDPASIDAFAERFLATARPLHVLINGAVIATGARTLDARGYEIGFATTHLGHFQLTSRLYPALKAAHGARVVTVTSGAHRLSDIRWDDLNFARSYEPHVAYGQGKTANILFTVELDRRWQADGIRGYAPHPGISVASSLAPGKTLFSRDQLKAMGLIDDAGLPIIDPANEKKTPQQAAATIVFAATSPRLANIGGVYLKNSDIAPVDADTKPRLVDGKPVLVTDLAPHAVDPDSARRLWDLSERMLAQKQDQR